MMSRTPPAIPKTPKMNGSRVAATRGRASKMIPNKRFMIPRTTALAPSPFKALDQVDEPHHDPLNTEDDDERGRDENGAEERMIHHEDAGQDTDDTIQ